MEVEVKQPSVRNVRGVEGSGWFTKETFIVTPKKDGEGEGDGKEDGMMRVDTSPNKKQRISNSPSNAQPNPAAALKTDPALEARWTDAVTAMRDARRETERDEEMMFGVGSTPSKSMPKVKRKSKGDKHTGGRDRGRGRPDTSEDEDEDGDMIMVKRPSLSPSPSRERWSPPPPDPSLAIPGEKVFARENDRRARGHSKVKAKPTVTKTPRSITKTKPKPDEPDLNATYWPATLKYYKKPQTSSEEPKYGVLFLDGEEMEITRGMFFTTDQDEFAICKVSF